MSVIKLEAHYIIGLDTYVLTDEARTAFVIVPNRLGRQIEALGGSKMIGRNGIRPWPPSPENLKDLTDDERS